MSAAAPSLLQRIFAEHRRGIIALAALLILNLVLYVAVVYPLAGRVANIEQRDAAAEESLRLARADHAQASGTLTGKDRAAAELNTFYNDVLPASLSGARQLTHLRLPQLARQSGLRFERSQSDAEEQQGSTLSRLRIQMILSGSYADVRTFLHQLETAPEFVVIENVSLAEEDTDSGTLVVTLSLATYYREARQ